MSFSGGDGADAAQIVATGDHDQVARVELDVVLDLVGIQVEADGVVDLDVRVRVADGATVVRDDHWHALGRHHNLAHLAQLVLGLLLGDAVNGEATLHVIDQTEELVGLLERDHIYTYTHTQTQM